MYKNSSTDLYNVLMGNQGAMIPTYTNNIEVIAKNKTKKNDDGGFDLLKPFKDIGQSVVGMIGTGVASIKDLIEGTTGSPTGYKNGTSQWVEGKNTDAFKKWLYGEDDVKNVYNKAGGKALNAAADLASLAVPGIAGAGSTAMKAATSVGGNAAAGALGGVGETLAQSGSDATQEDILKGALSGALGGAAVGGFNKGLNAKIIGNGGNLINKNNVLARNTNKLINSGLGRGALSGAVGGATGAGTMSALSGQDIGTGLQNTLSGAQGGALQGAVAGAALSGANKVGNKIGNRVNDSMAEPDNGFGLRYNQFAGNGEGAINYLLKRGGGEVEGALRSPAVEKITGNGNVDLVYGKTGNDGYGLAHIVEKHGEGVARKIPSILENGKVVDDPKYTNANRITLVSDDNTGAVRLGWDGNKKQWVVTAYEGLPYSPASSANNEMATGTTLRGSSVQGQNDATVNPIVSQNRDIVNATGWDNLAREAGFNDYKTAVQSFALNNPGKAINASNVLDWLDQPVTKRNAGNNLLDIFKPEETNTIQRKNRLQSVGQQLQTAAKTQKYGALYDSLDAKTAARAVQTGAPEKLAQLGIRPENYAESAKTSNYINKVVSDLAEKSNVKANVPDLAERLSLDNIDVVMTDPAAKKYNSYIKQIVADGASPDEYSAGYLLRKSREFGNKAANLRGNTDDVNTLRAALTDAKYTLREIAANALEGSKITGELTNANIAKGLEEMGANNAVRDYYTELIDGKAPSVTDYIRRSSLFEQARDMGTQIEAEKYTRSASKAPTNFVTRMWNATGLDQPVNTLLRSTIAPVSGATTNVAGKLLEGTGDLAAKTRGRILVPEKTSTTTVTTSKNTSPETQILWNLIGRQENETQGNQARTAQYLTDAMNANNATTLEEMIAPTQGSNTNVYDSMYGTAGQQATATNAANNSYFPTTGDFWTDLLGQAMTLAIDADDTDAFTSLYSMYQDAISNTSKNATKDYSDTTNWSSGDRTKLLEAQNALGQIDQLESAYNQATSGNGGNAIQGNLRSLAANISGGNLDPSASNYNNLAQSIGMGIVKNMINLGVTESDAQRYLQYLPALTDTKEQAATKLETLRQIYQNQINNLYDAYGV